MTPWSCRKFMLKSCTPQYKWYRRELSTLYSNISATTKLKSISALQPGVNISLCSEKWGFKISWHCINSIILVGEEGGNEGFLIQGCGQFGQLETVWYSLIQLDTAWYSLIQPDTVYVIQLDTAWYSRIQIDTGWNSLLQPATVWYSLLQSDTAWYSLIQPDAVWYSLIQSDTAWLYGRKYCFWMR